MSDDQTTPEPLAPLDEQALRRPPFELGITDVDTHKPCFDPDSVPVALLDGQTWHLARPGVGDLFPIVVGGEFAGIGSGSRFGADFDDAVARIERPDSSLGGVEAALRVATAMLARNYQIPDDRWPELIRFQFDLGDDSGDDYMPMWRAILAVAQGDDPAPADATSRAGRPAPSRKAAVAAGA